MVNRIQKQAVERELLRQAEEAEAEAKAEAEAEAEAEASALADASETIGEAMALEGEHISVPAE